MKRLLTAVAIVLGLASSAWGAAAPATLTTLHSIHALSNAEAGQGLPVAFEATVTFFRGSEGTLFVQDGDEAIYVAVNTDARLVPGDRVLVEGKTHKDFSATVHSEKITLLRHGALPKPVPATFDELIRAQRDCMIVTVHAVVRAVDLHARSDMRGSSLPPHTVASVQMLMEGGYIEAFINTGDAQALSGMLDAEVEATGVAGLSFDGKMQPTGAQLNVASLGDVKILKRAQIDPWSLPITPMNRTIAANHVRDLTQRIRIHGSITYYHPGSAVVIQDGTKSMWIGTDSSDALQIGDEADAIGFPDSHNALVVLTRAEIQDRHVQKPIQPLAATWKQLSGSGNLYDLVSIEGQVVTVVREALQDEYVLAADGQLFTAIYRHEAVVSPMKRIAQGTGVRVTGICIVEDTNPFAGQVPFDILLRSPDDIAIIAQPSLLTVRNLILVLSLTLLAVIGVGAWGWILNTKVRRQTGALAAMAEFEHRRSRILEDINGAKPLAEILEETMEMISFRLNGAPCWCEITDGARLGNCPADAGRLRILQEEIQARSGPGLGNFFAGFNPEAPHRPTENEALSAGAKLATLAIETRRLYSDLLHRSEFDLLTDIHNRFSLEAHLDTLIEDARQNAAIFGLIYIDLDDFKQVNDLYGHHVGDLYLQEVAERMKRQLRPHDLLARLGGDEFAVLLPKVRNRAGVEEIAQRLEHCFDAPLTLEGHTMQGAASMGIALYPEDSATRDGLLSAADAAMYAAKHSKRPIEMSLDQSLAPEPSPVSHA